MTQSYFGYRVRKIGMVVALPFRWIGRVIVKAFMLVLGFLGFCAEWFVDWFPMSLIMVVAALGAILLFTGVLTFGNKNGAPVKSATPVAPKPDPAVAAPAPQPKDHPVLLMKVIRTGVQGITVIEDLQSGCEYLVITGRAPVPREFSGTQGIRQWCEMNPPVSDDAEVPDNQTNTYEGSF